MLADMLCAAADDEHITLTRRDANRLASHAIELLALADWHLEHDRISNPPVAHRRQ